ncbi:iron complex transport system substrate-binding protein [Nonomuraea maritima]|uniref:Iron complex transport system substrate-binding protein n=1 Tax=Nonomuraea maritima TaxID=683260 RepID=A0A1G8YWN6_9ACTN|nr:iron-siderophore ABC transporter substrate-binding protein [Nonomuraea maritima]SDK07269.1 iron complex transport system substrate-binding protein [Nonomuraea maritima]
MKPSWKDARLAALNALAVFLVATVAACGAAPATTTAPQPEPSTATAAGGPYPVSIEHKYGSTTIPAKPQRIVTVGLTDQDAVLALGEVPVGTTEWFGGFKGAIGPWAEDELAGRPVPTVLTDTGSGPQVEKIAALRPDLILALYSGLSKEQYETLSKFAPVVAPPARYKDYGIPWQVLTETVGRALGRADEARSLVAGVEARFADERAEHPEFADATGLVLTLYEGFFVYGSEDLRTRTLTSLGFKLPADLDKALGDQFGASVSKERTDLLDQDVAVWTVPDVDKDSATLHKDPVYGDLPVVKEGREVFVGEGSAYGSAFSFVSVLSLPYVLDRLVPQLAAAVDGDPATKVAPPAS